MEGFNGFHVHIQSTLFSGLEHVGDFSQIHLQKYLKTACRMVLALWCMYKYVPNLEIHNFVKLHETIRPLSKRLKTDFSSFLLNYWRMFLYEGGRIMIKARYLEGSRLSFEARLFLKCRVPLTLPYFVLYCFLSRLSL